MAINHKELQKALAKMSKRSLLYKIVKAEIQKRGNWKNAPRGKPFEKN